MHFISKTKSALTLMRPYQWIKNILLFAPLFFSGKNKADDFKNACYAMLCFCVCSSLGYILNDWMDREDDSYHPRKKKRPICSGKVSGTDATILSVILIIITIAFLMTFNLPKMFIHCLFLYMLLTFSYSLRIKDIVILELFAVSFGFVLRVLAGGAACSINVSSWLFMTVFFISVMISVAKRISEFDVLGHDQAILHRKSQKGYSLSFLKNLLWTCGGISLVVYALYVVERSGLIVYSVLLASYGVFRFMYTAEDGRAGDPVKLLFKDHQLLLVTIIFLLFMWMAIYYKI